MVYKQDVMWQVGWFIVPIQFVCWCLFSIKDIVSITNKNKVRGRSNHPVKYLETTTVSLWIIISPNRKFSCKITKLIQLIQFCGKLFNWSIMIIATYEIVSNAFLKPINFCNKSLPHFGCIEIADYFICKQSLINQESALSKHSLFINHQRRQKEL